MSWSNNTTLIQQVYDAAKEYATRSKGTAAKEPARYRPRPQELPTVPPELTSELLRCLSTLLDPWPLAKVDDQHGQCHLSLSKFLPHPVLN